jgi:indolepyruvate ferredoxin oxidoreductase
VPGETRLGEALARFLSSSWPDKQADGVARPHLKAEVRARLAAEYPGGARVQYNLDPPVLRALGLRRKLRSGSPAGRT